MADNDYYGGAVIGYCCVCGEEICSIVRTITNQEPNHEVCPRCGTGLVITWTIDVTAPAYDLAERKQWWAEQVEAHNAQAEALQRKERIEDALNTLKELNWLWGANGSLKGDGCV